MVLEFVGEELLSDAAHHHGGGGEGAHGGEDGLGCG